MDGFQLPTIPKHELQPGIKKEDIDAEAIFSSWLSGLGACIDGSSFDGLRELFLEECWWRDFISMNWDFTSKSGIENIRKYLATATNRLSDIQPVQTGGLKAVLVELPGMTWIQGAFTFKSGHGNGCGMVKLLNINPTEWKAWIVFTQLEKLDFQDELEAQRALNPAAIAQKEAVKEAASSRDNGVNGANGSQLHDTTDEDDLQVLIIGAGQAGLCLGARLKDMGLSTLLVDRNPRFGDSWRKRYRSVTLNTPTYTDHPPFMKFPHNWPRWLHRDMVADFWEHYAQIMGLECLHSTEVTNVEYDEPTRRYTVQLKKGECTSTLSPRHVVLATGVYSDEPIRPDFPGSTDFTGHMYHSKEHVSADEIPGVQKKKIVVVGAGTSAHDIAQDYVNSGAKEVSIIQRNPIFYLSSKASEFIQLGLWNMEGISTEEADLAGNSYPLAVIRAMGIGMTHAMTEIDRTMIEGLQKAGMALRTGHDGYGLADYQLIKGGHFYLDQGASQMIVDGRIKLHRCEKGVKDVQSDGLTLANGTKLEADVIVLATGYHSSIHTVERLMGNGVAAKMSPHFGILDAENERAGWWRPTGQPGLWYMTGSFMWCRQFSLFLALQIAAVEKNYNSSHYK